MSFIDSTAKTNWTFIGVIVALGLFVVGVVLFLQYSSTPSEVPQPSQAFQRSGEQELATEEQVQQEDNDVVEQNIYTPEQVLASSEELNGRLLEIEGMLTMVPFVDRFGLGGASPKFVTANGSIGVSNPSNISNFTNRNVVARGVYDSETMFLSFNCDGCGLRFAESTLKWEVPINLELCQPGEQRIQVHGLGSNTVRIVKKSGEYCVVEYIQEVEMGYTSTECYVATSEQAVSPSDVYSLCYTWGGGATGILVPLRCKELVDEASQNYESYASGYQRGTILGECTKYLAKNCSSHQDCGSFPCQDGQCLVKVCSVDTQCPQLCGLHATPVPRFCTTIDIQ